MESRQTSLEPFLTAFLFSVGKVPIFARKTVCRPSRAVLVRFWQTHPTGKWTGQKQSHQRADLRAIADQTTNFPPTSLERCTGLARAITAHSIQPEPDRVFIIIMTKLYIILYNNTRDINNINIFNYYL